MRILRTRSRKPGCSECWMQVGVCNGCIVICALRRIIFFLWALEGDALLCLHYSRNNTELHLCFLSTNYTWKHRFFGVEFSVLKFWILERFWLPYFFLVLLIGVHFESYLPLWNIAKSLKVLCAISLLRVKAYFWTF